MKTKVVIIGAGPAGLTAGYFAFQKRRHVVVLEADPIYVGGIRARQLTRLSFRYRRSPFSQNPKRSKTLWTEILRTTCSLAPLIAHFFTAANFFVSLEADRRLLKLGVFKSILCILSWLKARLFPVRTAEF